MDDGFLIMDEVILNCLGVVPGIKKTLFLCFDDVINWKVQDRCGNYGKCTIYGNVAFTQW